MLAHLPCQDLRERDHSVLGDAVGAEADIGHEAGERRGEQHVTTLALFDETRYEHLDTMDRTPQVDVDDPSPIVVTHLGDRATDRDAGVVEDDVHLPEHPK